MSSGREPIVGLSLPNATPLSGTDPVDARIRACRTASATINVTAGGSPLAGHEVVVAQRRHHFLFGGIGFEFLPLANGEQPQAPPDGHDAPQSLEDLEHLAEQWFDVFNAATLPFYWGRFEPVRGRPDTARLLRAAEWFTERGCVVKGHPLTWHTICAGWLLDLPNEEILRTQVDRIHREMRDFAGVIDMWDVINEVVIMPVFDQEDNGITRLCREMGRIPLVRRVFEEARRANPDATLLLNDFDMSTGYECLIEGLLEAGVGIDVLGLQSHMHQGYWGEEKTLDIIDRFSRYGLPIHFTETTLLSGEPMPPEYDDLNDFQPSTWPSTPEGEARQAEEIVRHYRTLLSHPSVRSATYWGISDHGAWLGAPGGLVRADGTPKPAYDALRSLVKGEWWVPPTTVRTDADGRIRLDGFLGEYEISAAGTGVTVTLDRPGEIEVTADLTGGNA